MDNTEVEIEALKEHIENLQKRSDAQSQRVANLVEYLERTGVIPKFNDATFESWEDKLAVLQREEKVAKELIEAKQFLTMHGYIVVRDKNDVDAQILRSWIDYPDE